MHLVDLRAKTTLPFVDPETSEVCAEVQSVEWAPAPADGAFAVGVTARVIVRDRAAERIDPAEADPDPGGASTGEVAEVGAVYTAIYTSTEPPTEEVMSIFRHNAVVHVWPLFRQTVRSVTSDFGWVPVVLPVLPPADAPRAEASKAE